MNQRRQQRIGSILSILRKLYPDARCSLNFNNPLQLLVATILSAQCTDERVNKVTAGLFAKYKTAADFAKVSQEELEKEIQSTGFFRNKAKSIRAMAAALVQRHAGKVPRTMEELTELAGVGRKTANVVLGNAFDINVGIVVDTHVARISGRLGLTRQTDPVKIERDLMEVVPREDWTIWPHLLIQHGRALCTARNPKCERCPLLPDCPAGKKFVKQRSIH
ncbi:MAG: endonuclease III [Phycisphaerales bacterium]|nr:endonuclease III [Phycisphaerales bacterium]